MQRECSVMQKWHFGTHKGLFLTYLLNIYVHLLKVRGTNSKQASNQLELPAAVKFE